MKKTLLSEDDWEYIKKYNPTAKLKKNCIRFVPYGTKQALTVLGKARVILQCQGAKKLNTTVYVVAGQTENLLGERDSVALGILAIRLKGERPSQETVGNMDEFVKEGILEGPLESEHGRGWVHNVVLTKKKWNEKAIRLNIDTTAMEKYVDVTHFPIPMANS